MLQISVVTRDEVGAYKPYLWEQSTFHNGVLFREWLLTKIVNGERASYSAPKFARMQERTRSQMLEDIVANLQNHAETGQIPKPYRWVPLFSQSIGMVLSFPGGYPLPFCLIRSDQVWVIEIHFESGWLELLYRIWKRVSYSTDSFRTCRNFLKESVGIPYSLS